jgi:hypothetical protein
MMLPCQHGMRPAVPVQGSALASKSGFSQRQSARNSAPWKASRDPRKHNRCTSIVGRFRPTPSERIVKRANELAIRKQYLLNFWYAAGFGKQLRDGKFLPTKLLDTPVLLWRSTKSHRVHCITDQCPCTGKKISSLLTKPPTLTNENGNELMCDPLNVMEPFNEVNHVFMVRFYNGGACWLPASHLQSP